MQKTYLMNKLYSSTNKCNESKNTQYNLPIYCNNEDLMGFSNISYKYFALCYTAFLYRQIYSGCLNTDNKKKTIIIKVITTIEKEYISNCVRPLINSLPPNIQEADPNIIKFNSKINYCNTIILKKREENAISNKELTSYKDSLNDAIEAAHHIVVKYGNKYNKIYRTLIYNIISNTNQWFEASEEISKLIYISEDSTILFNRKNLSVVSCSNLTAYDKDVELLGFMIFSMLNTATYTIYNHLDSINSDIYNIRYLMNKIRNRSDSFIINNCRDLIINTLHRILTSYYKEINVITLENYISSTDNCTTNHISCLIKNIWYLLTIIKRLSEKHHKMIDDYIQKYEEWYKNKNQISKSSYNIEEPIFELHFKPYDIPYYKLTSHIIPIAHLLYKHINTN